MADPSTIAVLVTIVEYAEYVGMIVSAIETASEIFGQPDKQQDEATRKILEEIARAETSIIDAIHNALLNEQINAIGEASNFWGNTWLFIVKAGITFGTVDSDGALHGVELDMPIKRDKVSTALNYFHQAREDLPPTPGMLKLILGGYSLHLSMETVWTAFTWIRNLHAGNSSPPRELLDHTTYLNLGRETITAWLANYLRFRRSHIQTTWTRELANDETVSPSIWDYTYFVTVDSGDAIINTLEAGTEIGQFTNRSDETAPKPDEVDRRILSFLRGRWEKSDNGAKAVEAVFKEWDGVKTQVGLLLHS